MDNKTTKTILDEAYQKLEDLRQERIRSLCTFHDWYHKNYGQSPFLWFLQKSYDRFVSLDGYNCKAPSLPMKNNTKNVVLNFSGFYPRRKWYF